MPSLKPRAANLNELAAATAFLWAARPLNVDPTAASLLEGDAPAILASVHSALDALDGWDTESLEDAVRQVAENAQVKLGRSHSRCVRH